MLCRSLPTVARGENKISENTFRRSTLLASFPGSAFSCDVTLHKHATPLLPYISPEILLPCMPHDFLACHMVSCITCIFLHAFLAYHMDSCINLPFPACRMVFRISLPFMYLPALTCLFSPAALHPLPGALLYTHSRCPSVPRLERESECYSKSVRILIKHAIHRTSYTSIQPSTCSSTELRVE